MKIEYTQAQQAAARLYRLEQEKLRALESQSEELLMDGNYVLRERVLKEADRQRSHLDGLRRMAAVMGFPEDALMKAVKAVEVEEP